MRHPAALLLCAAAALAPSLAHADGQPLRAFLSVALAPDGRHVASVEGDEPAGGGRPDVQSLVIRDRDGKQAPVTLPCGAVPQCTPSDLAWAPDGQHVAFVLRTPGSHAHGVYLAAAAGGAPEKLLGFDGTLGGLRFGPDGTLALLATAAAAKETGAVEAGAALTGELGADIHEQRIATLRAGALHWESPPDLFVYEYDWRPGGPGGAGFVGTAAPGDGDDNWWVAKLYAFEEGKGRVVYTPSNIRQQLAQPRVSPDGAHVAFIGGLMSDFGSTGGDAFLLDLARGDARNLTPGWPASVRSIDWGCDGKSLRASLLQGELAPIVELPLQDGAVSTLDRGERTLRAGEGEAVSVACASREAATVREDFATPPEIAVGPLGDMRDLTRENAGRTAPMTARALSWEHDGFKVSGWLLEPAAPPAGGGKRPMIVWVHGGPAAAAVPRFIGAGWYADLLGRGYALLLPNPRGSFGQGEAFAAANVRDLGYGDLGDILAGVDAAEAAAPIDDARLGIAGWSYGGFMTMFAVTQTDRFHAAFAGAGIADWQSYYGQNGIDAWMTPYFGRSVYDDPDIYARSSPITFIKQVKTPTFAVVGERDVECPAPQTLEFWHALNALGVPTGAVVYPAEGHAFRDPKNVADLGRRLVGWFDAHLGK